MNNKNTIKNLVFNLETALENADIVLNKAILRIDEIQEQDKKKLDKLLLNLDHTHTDYCYSKNQKKSSLK